MTAVGICFLMILAQCGAEYTQCSAPVICSSNGVSSPEWMPLYPDRSCQIHSPHAATSLTNLTEELQRVNARISSLENHSKLCRQQLNNTDGIIKELKLELSEQNIRLEAVGSITNPGRSCQEIFENRTSPLSGQYFIQDNEGNTFLTYCDMVTGNGGWTLVASVHENNMKGRCTAGDRWSSEQGNSPDHPHGDGFWENRAIHGAASSATSDDFKSPGYFTMNASDLMIWHVPNNTPLSSFESASFLKYHTSSGFLQHYGGNLQTLFDQYYLIRSKEFKTYTDNGPAISIVWDKGDNESFTKLHGLGIRGYFEPGFIQFRVINTEGNAFALCPGSRIRPNVTNVEHVCVGSTSNNIGHPHEEEYCGDFAAKDWIHHPEHVVSEELINSVIFIFYR